MTAIPTTVIRHAKERLSKCSLRFLHGRPDVTFLRASPGFAFDAAGFTLLAVDAAPLSPADAGRPLLLLDSTWRWLPQLAACLRGEPARRSIPAGIRTAYPRRSRLWDDPEAGLASVEALYVARRILGDDDPSLLAGYHWREQFLAALPPIEPGPARRPLA
jgi:pre-rRNA-processing protein TSR3